MATTLIIDFSRVLIFAHADTDSLNELHRQLSEQGEDYGILDHFYLNEELFGFLDSVKPAVKICLFSDGVLHLVSPVRERVEAIADTIITAEQIGYKKSEPKVYTLLLQQLELSAKDALFVDDKQANIEAASNVGIQVVHFIDNTQALPALNTLLKKP
jgi:HAD superfamily hydrolase (TIGR01549 family)